ncbi:MAG TPA: hypothetical protein VMR41_03350 [Patescibacteria group bacterium]|nr:hypothetical protein [Patescibacteria group bacterium]
MLTIKELLLQAFEAQERELTVEELSHLTDIAPSKIRQRLTPYEQEIVRVGNNTYDLAKRVYKGKTFRYTPSKREIEKGVLRRDDDLGAFLTAWNHHDATITLIDDKENQYNLSHHVNPKVVKFPYYSGIAEWYKRTDFEEEDDILLKCIDIRTYTFSIWKEKRTERDEFAIAIKNKKLAGLVYDILNHGFAKHESDFFLIRKYLYVYPYNENIPPDHLFKALAEDKRFIISSRDKMLSWTGRLLDHWLTIGLKKYYFQNDQNEWTPIFIGQNNQGRKFGYCSQCGEKMYWQGEYAWQHPQIQGEFTRKYLDKNFFIFEKDKKVSN